MKWTEEERRVMRTLLTIILTFSLVPAPIPASAQNQATLDVEPYDVCISAIKKTPLNAADSCRKYLEKKPYDDAARIKYVAKWLANYEKVLPYAKFLQGLPVDQKADWFVYEPDLDIELPQTSENKGSFQMEIARSFADSIQDGMLKKAEAVYSRPSTSVEEIFRSLEYWANEYPKEMAPVWGMRGNDNIQQASIVTARAVRYYYDLTLTERKNPHLTTGFTAEGTSLKYGASIKLVDKYTHKRETFEDVYVADLTLQWSFNCGMLCGMGFTRNKVVLLDRSGNVIAMFLDAPVNSQSWVS
jgi:hypothetical protein